MQWRWRVARVRGIDVFVHATFLLLLAWVAASSWARSRSIEGVLAALTLIVTVFAIVVLHELGHALTARRFGVGTRDITLYPIGGVARLERIPERPAHELAIALAGPAVNVALALVIGIALSAAGVSLSPEADAATTAPGFSAIPVQLFWINVALAVFNMLPAFPMDGGRVLRALLAMRLEHVTATEIAAAIGRAIALGLGLLGVLYSPMLVLVALFVWIAGGAEASAVEARTVLRGLPVRAAMLRGQRTLEAGASLGAAARALLEGTQTDFPVARDGAIVGVLTRARLIEALAERGREGRVVDAMHPGLEVAEPDETLDVVLERLERSPARAAVVVQRGAVVGMLTMENLGELLMVEDAIRRRARHSPVPATS